MEITLEMLSPRVQPRKWHPCTALDMLRHETPNPEGQTQNPGTSKHKGDVGKPCLGSCCILSTQEAS